MKWNDIHAIAFDLDGTLVDSIADLCAAANHMRAELGLSPLPESELTTYVGDGLSSLVHRALSGDRDGLVDETIWTQGFTAFISYYRTHLSVHTRPYPEVETALALFRARGLPLAVITNKNEILAVELLCELGLADSFSLVVGGDTLAEKKPSPMPLLHTAEVLGVPIGNLLMVGDSANDILAAKAAGALSCGVTWGYADMAQLAKNTQTKPDIIVDHLPQIDDGIRHHANSEIRA
ncbi:putative phosphatase [Snodgrassella alvi SCGC AB-598-P14]|uniref:phosphoglycolate phosphatase n=1 Tax=Snodgrassella TaxID=1193515 RepID=UPI0004D7C628|nr:MULTISPECIES: phosphoglycolate phosphatase [Snodgrassella]KES13344.1 putative phosphatase [Snodgrassella alvi SCGC AB-598-P14]MBI0067705.1 phosphoglycolate phosphatase [Snodgrassella sp. M0110]MBI0076331.1 phosphoglycolate phosphatase [Snodgrassella sp. M0118]MBI0079005.1 phosphoglycolate phosphatase [Snodgrassella sp. M0112]NUE80358.1 phosphoglycolate phosphatase [Snodgrassella sp. ESL0304]